MLLSANVEIVSVSRMREFYMKECKIPGARFPLSVSPAVTAVWSGNLELQNTQNSDGKVLLFVLTEI